MKVYTTKFSDIKGDYVIVEANDNQPRRGFFAFNFNRNRDEQTLKQGLNALEDTGKNDDAHGVPVQVNVDDALAKIADLYAKIRVLNGIYQVLGGINSNYAQVYDDFVAINTALLGGIANAYRAVSSGSTLPQTNVQNPNLPSQAQEILKIVTDYLLQLRKDNYNLLSLFEAAQIERQFNLVDSALTLQTDATTNLRLG